MTHASVPGHLLQRRMAIYISGGIGDVVLHMGHIRALAEQAGQPLVMLLPHSGATHGLFASQPYIEQVISLEDIQGDRKGRVARLSEVLREQRIETLFLFTFQRFVAQAARRARVPRRVGFIRYHQPHLAGLLTHRGWVRRRGTPHPDTHTWLPPILRRCGYRGVPVYPSLEVAPEAQAQVRGWLPASGKQLLGVGLNGSTPDKRYDGEAFAQVIGQLHACCPGLSFLLFGARDVADTACTIRACLPAQVPVLDITDAGLDLRASHALLAECEYFIGNDSMGLHLAVAHRIPSIGLFGATPPMSYVPWLHPIVSTRPSRMDGIAPQAVVAAACEHFKLRPVAACASASVSLASKVDAFWTASQTRFRKNLWKMSAGATALFDKLLEIGLEFNSYLLGG